MKSGYDNQTAEYEQNLDAWEKKRKHPQTFENEISEIQKRLGEYRESMSGFVEKVRQEFTGKESLYDEKLKQIRDEHLDHLRNAASLDAAKRALENFYSVMRSLGDDVGVEIESQFEEELNRLGEEFEAKYHITVPTIDISAINLKAMQEAYDKDVPRSPKGAWEWTQKIFTLGLRKFTKDRYSNSKHLSNFKSGALEEMKEIVAQFSKLMSNHVDNYVNSLRSDLNTLIDSSTRTLEEIKKSKAENDEILENIRRAEQKKKVIAAEVARINDVLGNIR